MRPSQALYLAISLQVLTSLSSGAPGAQSTCVVGGDGTFTTPVLTPFPTIGVDLAHADMNEDGRLDIVTSNGGPAGLAITLGLGDGTFGQPVSFYAGQSCSSILVRDFNNDNRLDVAVRANDPEDVSILIGNGAGGMLSRFTYDFPGTAMMVDAGDLDNDGIVDLVVPTRLPGQDDGEVIVLMGNGNGTFSALPGFIAERPAQVRLGDLDQDGTLDLLLVAADGQSFELTLHQGLGDGTFAMPTLIDTTASGGNNAVWDPTMADIDRDGVIDLLARTSTTLTFRRGLGGGALGPAVGIGGGGAVHGPITVVDLNGDQNPDVVGSSPNQEVLVALGSGGGSFGLISSFSFGQSGYDHAVADFDSDGSLDLVLPGPNDLIFAGGSLVSFDDDDFEDNDTCSSATALASGFFPDLVVYRDSDEDFFKITVPANSTLQIDLGFRDVLGDIDCYLYDSGTVGSTCGDKSDFMLRAFTATDNEHLTWTNNSAFDRDCILQVSLWSSLSNAECARYDLSVGLLVPPTSETVCAGDGSDGACPCLNESLTPFEGCRNSKGDGARIHLTGSNLVALDDAQVHLSQAISGNPALLLQGSALISNPLRDGILCMGAFTERIEVVELDGNGQGSSSVSIATEGGVTPGTTLYYQWWYRDPGVLSPCGTGSNFSAGIAVSWQ